VSLANDVRGVALILVDLLERNAVPYALMGGMAVPVWGIPRATYDIDVVLSVDEEGLRRLWEDPRGVPSGPPPLVPIARVHDPVPLAARYPHT